MYIYIYVFISLFLSFCFVSFFQCCVIHCLIIAVLIYNLCIVSVTAVDCSRTEQEARVFLPRCSVLTRRGQWRAAMCLLVATLPHSWPSDLSSVTVTLKYYQCQLSRHVPHLTPTSDAVLSTFNKSKIRSPLG